MKHIIILFAFILIHQTGLACDACGCAIGYNGLLATYHQSFVSARFQHASFTHSSVGEGTISDRFQLWDISYRYLHGERWRFLLNVPVKNNVRNDNGVKQTLKGVGDVLVMASYVPVSQRSIGTNSKLHIELGGGLKLPTGVYDDKIHDRELPNNFNVGFGNYALLFQPSVVLSKGKWSMITTAAAQYNFRSRKSLYLYGHHVNALTSLYREVDLGKKVAVIPFVGLNFENIKSDSYVNGNTVDHTSGKGFFGNAGVQCRWKATLAGVQYGMPLSQNYGENESDASPRISVFLNYFL